MPDNTLCMHVVIQTRHKPTEYLALADTMSSGDYASCAKMKYIVLCYQGVTVFAASQCISMYTCDLQRAADIMCFHLT